MHRNDTAAQSGNEKIHVLVMNVSMLDGMASSARVRDLLEPMITDGRISVSNLIYDNYRFGEPEQLNFLRKVIHKVIPLSMSKPATFYRFLQGGFSFIRKSRVKTAKNILYFYDYPDVKSIMFVLYARLLGYKVIIDMIEDNDFFTQYISLVHRFRITSSRFFLRFTPRFTSAYIGISDHIVEKLKKLTADVPVHFVPVTVQMKWFAPSNGISDDADIRIFYGGSFAAKDGLSVLIDAFDRASRSVDNIHLVLTGRGQQHDMDAILHQVGKLEHKKRVHFKGYLSTPDYYALMNTCHIFCMTRNRSAYANAGFPFKLGEFLACGKAIIATKVGDVQKYLVNGKNALLIEPESATELAESIVYFITHKEEGDRMGKEARHTAEENFDSEKLSEQLYAIFKQV